MIKCDYCGKREEDNCGYTKNFCDTCIKDKEIGTPYARNMTYLREYGQVSVARLDEMSRRVAIPDKNAHNGYRLGRLQENGKVHETKMPDYYK